MAIRLTGLNSGLDTETLVKELMSAHSVKLTKIENKKTKNTWAGEKWKDLNKKIYSLYTGSLSKARLSSSYQTKKATSSNSSCVEITATSKAPAGAHTVEVQQLASAQYVTGNKTEIKDTKVKLSELGFAETDTITVNGKEFKTEKDTTVKDFLDFCDKQGINANYDTTQKRFFLSSKESGADQKFTLATSNKEALGKKMGLEEISFDDKGNPIGLTGEIQIVSAKDATIILDGATLTTSTNDPEINGLKLNLKQETTSPVTVSVSNDTKGVYDSIVGMFSEYNAVLKEMNECYNAASSKGYEPLTDEQKEAMSEDEVEKWEKKIKDSLLRKDSTLGMLLSAFKTAMAKPVEIDGKMYSLADLGITTSSDYTERGLLHVKGDSNDSTYANEENKLMKMLEEDPELVGKILSGVATNLYDTMTQKMSSTSLSSALTFYNDKQITKAEKKYDEEIAKMKKKLEELENRYYKQFAAMEAAMAKLNSQQSSLAGLLGE